MATIDDFRKLEIRVADVLEVEPHPNADKLYVLKIQLGTEQRQIVAGIRPYYLPEELKGRKVAVVVNLEPVLLRGVESQGMLLAASGESGLGILTLDRPIPSGAVIK
jgi:methionyl-tRNA synthetase